MEQSCFAAKRQAEDELRCRAAPDALRGQGAIESTLSVARPLRAQGAIELRCGTTAGTLRGQGATEYLMLLGAVLVVALVGVSLLSYTPSVAGDIMQQESQLYWQGQAKPFAISGSKAAASAGAVCGGATSMNMSMVMKNNERWRLELDEVYVDSQAWNFCVDGNASTIGNVSFAPGEERAVSLGKAGVPNWCGGSRSYQARIAFKYNSPYTVGKIQNGTAKLVVNCG